MLAPGATLRPPRTTGAGRVDGYGVGRHARCIRIAEHDTALPRVAQEQATFVGHGAAHRFLTARATTRQPSPKTEPFGGGISHVVGLHADRRSG